ncbi:MAG: hypothetical protein HRT89_23185 [Lentisphaeria bacterium]|nr:hypothetical protein [Lentisphaeria bacterium]NQZ70965.1 hypothetical protein [Lentisphaeria bacterium]
MYNQLCISVFILSANLLFSADRQIHCFVALCDNKSQGIVPVSKTLGDGDSPRTNLYWGAMYGIKTWFKRSSAWKLEKTIKNPSKSILERIIFKHKNKDVWFTADAYRGSAIKQCTKDFFEAFSKTKSADLNIYIGHNGLMDFKLKTAELKPKKQIDAIILACKSKQYFGRYLKSLNASPLLLTTQFMAPEAYTLEAALSAWVYKLGNKQIHFQASAAYSKYQKCSLTASKRLFYTK